MNEKFNELSESVTIHDWNRWEEEKKWNQEITDNPPKIEISKYPLRIEPRSWYIDFPSLSHEQIEEHIRELFLWHESGNMAQRAIINMKAYVQNEEFIETERQRYEIEAQITTHEIIMHIQYQVQNNLI